MRTFRMGGVHPADKKISKDAKIEKLPIPKIVYISMGQHLGAPAAPCVAVGDKVKVGQLIGTPTGFVSAPVHSSVSGTVKVTDGSTCISCDAAGNCTDCSVK